MKKLLLLALLIPAGSALGYTFTIHNTTDTDMDVILHQAWTLTNAQTTVPAGATKALDTSHSGTCTRAVEAIGSGKGSANGLRAEYNYTGDFGTCGGHQIYIRHESAQSKKGGININVGGTQSSAAQTGGTLEITSE